MSIANRIMGMKPSALADKPKKASITKPARKELEADIAGWYLSQ